MAKVDGVVSGFGGCGPASVMVDIHGYLALWWPGGGAVSYERGSPVGGGLVKGMADVTHSINMGRAPLSRRGGQGRLRPEIAPHNLRYLTQWSVAYTLNPKRVTLAPLS